jgi:hypothetical protein
MKVAKPRGDLAVCNLAFGQVTLVSQTAHQVDIHESRWSLAGGGYRQLNSLIEDRVALVRLSEEILTGGTRTRRRYPGEFLWIDDRRI